ncbi:histidine phosphatase family protein [Ornithinibacillus scapharcae]|uniref:histidine phosphatase family protein n=1 Tax=Ornithinibacillus scapharcae TaxID=1147159 RepID=UPI000225BE26|nr:histidine phosphatase family protein [Ornithinibacillus scapharcae]
MNTYIYMVRHAESPHTVGTERTRGLTEKGEKDVERVTQILKDEGIEVLISSPYKRAVLTIQDLANHVGKEVIVHENLKERIFSNEEYRIPDKELYPLLHKSFSNTDYALPGAESIVDCQSRAISVLNELLVEYKGKHIVLGTHGLVMTLMMRFFDQRYDLDFLLQMSKPDIYRIQFNGSEMVEVKRLWAESE